MDYIVHVPKEFQYLDDLEKYVGENDLSLAFLNKKSKTFHVIGNEKSLDKFLSYLEKYENDGVVVIGSASEKPSVKTYIKNIVPLNAEHVSKPHVNPPYFTAKEIAAIYNIAGNPTNRAGIAIIELGGGYHSSDINTYWNHLGLLTKPNVYSISVDGAFNSPGNDADAEVVLDIEVVGGICPNSNIYVYFAPNTDKGFYDAIHQAVYSTKYPVSIISISWGAPENEWSSQTMSAYNSLFQAAAQLGITICAASGDSGSSDGEASGLHVDFPSSSPWVLACGGTRLSCPDRVYDAKTQEIVWGTIPGNGAAGGGFSNVFTRPSYQNNLLTRFLQKGRGVPDVCGDADPATGWLIYLNGSYYVIGGTSAVAPMWASYLASIGFNKFLNPILYSLYSTNKIIVHDIVIGNEGAYSAIIGWDPASGLGSPNGNFLTKVLKSNEKIR